MTLPEGFIFSQSSLQDYVDCQRRFQLRYMLHQAWPAVEVEPYLENERLMDQGAHFHQIIRQHLLGVPKAKILPTITGDELIEQWWNNYLHALKEGELKFISEAGNTHYEEIILSRQVGQFRLIAKYDLLVICPDGKLVILDWKTSRNRPRHTWLADRLQTHVYPFVLARAAKVFMDGKIPNPAQIEMLYWFANHPEQPEHFTYDPSRYREDERSITDLISNIQHKTEQIFPLTPDVRRCMYCTYRSLCNRGVSAGDLQHLKEWQEPDSSQEIDLDFDHIGEIEF